MLKCRFRCYFLTKEDMDWLIEKEKMPLIALTVDLRRVGSRGGGKTGPGDVDVWWRKNFCHELTGRSWPEAFGFLHHRDQKMDLLPHPSTHKGRKKKELQATLSIK